MALPAGTTVAVGAGAGTGGSVAATLLSTSNDERGVVQVVTGASGTAAGVLAVVTFAGSYNGYDLTANLAIVLTGNSGTLGTLTVSAQDKNSFTISCTGTPATGTTYRVNYVVVA